MVTYLVDDKATLGGICWKNGRNGLGEKGKCKLVGFLHCVHSLFLPPNLNIPYISNPKTFDARKISREGRDSCSKSKPRPAEAVDTWQSQ